MPLNTLTGIISFITLHMYGLGLINSFIQNTVYVYLMHLFEASVLSVMDVAEMLGVSFNKPTHCGNTLGDSFVGSPVL